MLMRNLGLSVPGYLQIDIKKEIHLLKVLSQGGFGLIYLAKSSSPMLSTFGDKVVIKQAAKERLNDLDVLLFYQEVALMEYFKLEDNFAKLLGFSVDPYCLVMKFYEHGSLLDWIKTRSSTSKRLAVSFLHGIASGVLAMHVKFVAHMDLKPHNILIDFSSSGDPFCVLTDLGIAQVISPAILKVKQFRVAEIKALSLAYAAPDRIRTLRDQLLFNDKNVVLSWDVYSFALIIFVTLFKDIEMYH
jgi:serine/threonine protein kinase